MLLYIMYLIKQALKKTCKDKCLELEYIHGDFAFNSNRQIKMDHTKEPSSSGWIACFNNKDKVIKINAGIYPKHLIAYVFV